LRYWQDLKAGEIFQTGSLTISEKDILSFAEQFDPQPYHLDNEVAETTIFGGLCASGWQVAAAMMRLLTDTFKREGIAIIGVNGVPEMRWKIPVFADNSLSAIITLNEKVENSTQSDSNPLICNVLVSNQDGKPVVELTTNLLISCRPGGIN